jgi:hypothetical protein
VCAFSLRRVSCWFAFSIFFFDCVFVWFCVCFLFLSLCVCLLLCAVLTWELKNGSHGSCLYRSLLNSPSCPPEGMKVISRYTAPLPPRGGCSRPASRSVRGPPWFSNANADRLDSVARWERGVAYKLGAQDTVPVQCVGGRGQKHGDKYRLVEGWKGGSDQIDMGKAVQSCTF